MISNLSPSPLWILWIYLAGIAIIWSAEAWWFGTHSLTLKERAEGVYRAALARHKKEYPALRAESWISHTNRTMGYFIGIVFLAFSIGALWPIALPITLSFLRGRKHGQTRRRTQQLLTEANAELDRIRAQEGWLEP